MGESKEPGAKATVIPEEALLALAKALSDPSRRVFRVKSNSDSKKSYRISEKGPDLFCSCPGFEYRGTCSHIRKLQPALQANKPLPAGYSVVNA